MEYPPYVKLLFFFNKRDEISYEEFYRRWGIVHADLVMKSPIFLENAKSYVQLHMLPHQKEQIEDLNVPLLGFDACSEFYVKDVETWKKFWFSDYYQKDLGEDAALWLKGPIHVMVASEHVVYGPTREL